MDGRQLYIPFGPLPVTLLSFKGEENDGQHILHWKTSNEQNTSHFVIEHSSDAKLFKELGMTNAAGNSHEEKNYGFTYKTPMLGKSFYRLKMVDIDGKFTYSNVVLLNVIDNLTSISLYPNPTANILNVEIHNQKNPSQINMRISDLTGKTVWISDKTNLENKYQIDISSFASGMYFLIVEIQNEKQIIKFRRL